MATHLVTFANKKFKTAQRWLSQSARQFGILQQHVFTDYQFKQTAFYKEHQDITKEEFGVGFYIWKPYYILQLLEQLQENDVLLYMDSGQLLISDPKPLIDIASTRDIVLFENSQGFLYFSKSELPFTQENCYETVNQNKYWCKADCIDLMQANNEDLLTSKMVDASIMLFRKSERSMAFVKEWLHYCCDRRIISNDKNVMGKQNPQGFIMHIYDQSIISILAAKQHIELFRCPSQYGNHLKLEQFHKPHEYVLLPYNNAKLNSPYDTISQHHRYKNAGPWWRWKTFIYRECQLINTNLFRYKIPFITKRFKTHPYKLI